MNSNKPLVTLCAFALLTFAVTVALFPGSAMADPQASQQVQAQEQSWTGTIEQKELQGVKTYVLMVGGQAYPLDPQTKAAEFAGKTVKVTGKMEGGKVVISSIEEA